MRLFVKGIVSLALLSLLGIVYCVFFYAGISFAYTPETILFNQKKITPVIKIPDSYAKPPIFPQTNNLRRKSGSPFLAKGMYLGIKGQVTDLVGVPIANAVIKIWHANFFGYYNYLAKANDIEKFDVDFLGAGMCNTDNHGSYFFTTVMPGSYGNRAPHIHIQVSAPFFDTLETEIFFPDHPRNFTDKKYQSLSKREQELLTCFLQDVNTDDSSQGYIATFNIKLNGVHRYKTY